MQQRHCSPAHPAFYMKSVTAIPAKQTSPRRRGRFRWWRSGLVYSSDSSTFIPRTPIRLTVAPNAPVTISEASIFSPTTHPTAPKPAIKNIAARIWGRSFVDQVITRSYALRRGDRNLDVVSYVSNLIRNRRRHHKFFSPEPVPCAHLIQQNVNGVRFDPTDFTQPAFGI